MSLAAEAFVSQIAAVEPWPENATLYQPLKDDQILLSDCASSLAVQTYLRMCGLPVQVACKANAEYMSPSGKVPFVHVGNQVVSELGPIVQFTKAKGHSLSDGLDDVQRAEMKAYMELVHNMLLTAEISRPRYSSPYSWPLNHILAYQKQWDVRRKMKAIGWGGKCLEQVYEDVSQCCQALSQRLGTQPYFFNKQYVTFLSHSHAVRSLPNKASAELTNPRVQIIIARTLSELVHHIVLPARAIIYPQGQDDRLGVSIKLS
uniref:Thioredoxin-like fold domain-containing protein n=1 Tax=Gadus morhua TaxID=8049 RepID=A0A8C5BXV8_GADMO